MFEQWYTEIVQACYYAYRLGCTECALWYKNKLYKVICQCKKINKCMIVDITQVELLHRVITLLVTAQSVQIYLIN